jgi:hypothetical protein
MTEISTVLKHTDIIVYFVHRCYSSNENRIKQKPVSVENILVHRIRSYNQCKIIFLKQKLLNMEKEMTNKGLLVTVCFDVYCFLFIYSFIYCFCWNLSEKDHSSHNWESVKSNHHGDRFR